MALTTPTPHPTHGFPAPTSPQPGDSSPDGQADHPNQQPGDSTLQVNTRLGTKPNEVGYDVFFSITYSQLEPIGGTD